tara:strand:- start:6988 stop:7614 length:627 start_codon:yes stop_codon:yes gene_type:complete
MSAAANIYAQRTSSILEFHSLVTHEVVKFHAFLTSFTETFASSWNSEVVYGRNDPIGSFQGTARTLSLGWDVPAGFLAEARNNMESISLLTQMLYPGYTTATVTVKKEGAGDMSVGSNALSLSKPPLMRIKFANLIDDAAGRQNGLLGWITSLSANPTLDMGMFTTDGELYPKVFALSIQFNVLHEHDLGKTPGSKAFSNAPTFPFGG